MLFYLNLQPGLVSDCPLDSFSPNTCSPVSTDNDGLWTSWLAVSEAFRYQVTGNPQAQSNSWSFFQGLKFLVQVCVEEDQRFGAINLLQQ